jgi:hypothetical protein
MDVGQGRKQDAKALRLCESHFWLLKYDSFVKMLVTQGLLVNNNRFYA